MAAADEKVGKEIADGHDGACQTEHAQDMGTGQPFLSDEDDDELFADQRQREHERERDEGGEPQ